MASDASRDTPGGTIRRDTIYTLPAFRREAGIGRAGWRAMLAQGLRVHRVGKRVYVTGEDFARWLDKQQRGDSNGL